MLPPRFVGLEKYFAFQYGTARKHCNNKCGQHLQKVGIDTHPDNCLEYQIVEDRTKSNTEKAKSKVVEDLSKDCFTDDNCGKTDNDSTTSHVDIGKSLVLCKECTGKCNQSVGDHKAKYFTYIRIDSLCTGHIRITSGSAEGASKFCTEEPVKDCNQNNDKDCNDENCILIKWNIFYITEGNKQIKFVSVYCLV